MVCGVRTRDLFFCFIFLCFYFILLIPCTIQFDGLLGVSQALKPNILVTELNGILGHISECTGRVYRVIRLTVGD